MPLGRTQLSRCTWTFIIILLLTAGIHEADDPCVTYSPLNDSQNCVKLGSPVHSVPKWYRYVGTDGGKIAHSCPTKDCGAPGGQMWINDIIPTTADGITKVRACIRKNSKCCALQNSMQMKNCSDFLVYELLPPPCPASICFDQLQSTSMKTTISLTETVTQESSSTSSLRLTDTKTLSVTPTYWQSTSLTTTSITTKMPQTTKRRPRTSRQMPTNIAMSSMTTTMEKAYQTSHMQLQSTTTQDKVQQKNNPLTSAEIIGISICLGLTVIVLLVGIVCRKRLKVFIKKRVNRRSVYLSRRIRFSTEGSRLRGLANPFPTKAEDQPHVGH